MCPVSFNVRSLPLFFSFVNKIIILGPSIWCGVIFCFSLYACVVVRWKIGLVEREDDVWVRSGDDREDVHSLVLSVTYLVEMRGRG